MLMDNIQIPRVILERRRLDVLTVEVMFVNGIPFLLSLSRGLNLSTAELFTVRTAKSLESRLDQIRHLYVWGGFMVGTILMDNEFKKVRPLIPNLNIKTTAVKQLVPEIMHQ